MPNEYNGDKIVLRDTQSNQMSLPLFFKLATRNSDGSHTVQPSSGLYRNGSTEFHGAWDMGCNGATDIVVRTPTAGTVVYVGGAGGFGPNLVIVKEDSQERYHYFGHMASAAVQQGSKVEQGDEVGIAGGYGGSEGAWNPSAYPIHLHYEIMDINFKVSGGNSTNKAHVIDPMTAFDESTLPSGWQYGYDPAHPSNNYAAKNYNWDYIPLDSGAVDFGPSGGTTPSEPYYPTAPCHDIAHPQVSGGSLNPCINAIADAKDAGVIIQVGSIRSSGFKVDSHFDPAEAVKKVFDRGLGLGIYFYNYAEYATDQTQAFQDALNYLQTIGATKEKVNLGVWLDTEYNSELGYDPVPSKDPSVNYAYVERFMDVFSEAGYPVAGVYSSASNFEPWYGRSRIGDKPIWAAYWTGTFDTVNRSSLESYLPEAAYTNVYLMQYSDRGSVPGWSGFLDCVKVLAPMPTVGSGGGGGEGSYTLEVLVDVIPPKRIYFNPNPGVLSIDADLQNREQEVEILTDAKDATIYYTLDGSSPYDYNTSDVGNITYAISESANVYEEPIKIYSDTHIRAVAIPSTGEISSFDDILAKGSGTFLYSYKVITPEWSVEREAYALEDAKSHESLYEENKQAFILEHTKEAIEDIVYAAVHLSENTGGESESSEEVPAVEPADNDTTGDASES